MQLGIPQYRRIADLVRMHMNEQRMEVGQLLPSIQDMAAKYHVAPETIRQALTLLEREGLIQRRQGVGTVVSATPRDLRWLSLPTNWEGLVNFLGTLEVQRTLLEGAEEAARIEPDEGRAVENYTYLKRIHARNGEPFCVIAIHLAEEIYRTNPQAFREKVIVPLLAGMEEVEIGRVLQSLRFDVADMELSEMLQMPIASPVVRVRRTINDVNGYVIYAADIAYRGDVVSLQMDLSPPPGGVN